MEIILLVQRCCLFTEARLLLADCAAACPPSAPRACAHTCAHVYTLMGYSFWNHYGKYKGLQRIRKTADGLFSCAISNAKYNHIKPQMNANLLQAFTVTTRVRVCYSSYFFFSPWDINTTFRTEKNPQKLFFLYICFFCHKNRSHQTWRQECMHNLHSAATRHFSSCSISDHWNHCLHYNSSGKLTASRRAPPCMLDTEGF